MIKIKLETAGRLLGSFLIILSSIYGLSAQDPISDTSKADVVESTKPIRKLRDMKPVKFTFDDNYVLDNQSVQVPQKKAIEFDIQHRFGVITNGYKDFIGIFSAANIRFGTSYVPVQNLQLGFGINKYNLTWDFNAKYAIFRQSQKGKGIWPVSLTVFGNMAIDTRNKKNFVRGVDRISYFGQILIARKITKHFSVQVAADVSWFNNVEAYINADGDISPKRRNEHFAVAVMARYKFNDKVGILINYDQPLTQHPIGNPHPNIGAAVEFATAKHNFQVTFSNYGYLLPQINNFYNQNNYRKGQFCIGFNMTRLWFL